MNVQINQLVRSLLQKDDIGQCSLQELKQFAEKNPYFGAAQLLLTKKMQTEDPAGYDEQLQKTFLFFNNPLWVEQVLNGTGQATITASEKKPAPMPVLVQDSIPGSATVPEPELQLEELPTHAGGTPATPMDAPAAEIIIANEQTGTPPEPVTAGTTPSVEIPAQASPDPALKEELLFEPYYTVDYFASQGIKFKEEDKPKDKFGQQLKSFTDWLKAMKKLPVTEIAKTVEQTSPAQAEQKVEQLAAHSLAEREVMTEAMAEVWEKQGNKAKAIEIYRKLSLLDPAKSPYFAAKIEALNKQT